MACIERNLQHVINALSRWALENGFKFSTSKTVCMHFCTRRGICLDPALNLDGTPIPVVPTFKFLGVHFDRRLSFKPHIDYVRAKCQKALNLLRVIAARGWGADRNIKLMLYRALVRSKLDYGCIVYGASFKSHMAKLAPVQNQGLRICLNAFRTTNAASLHVEANEMPIKLRHIKLSMQYVVKTLSSPSNPTHKLLATPSFQHKFDRTKAIRPLGLRIRPHFEAAAIDTTVLASYRPSKVPPWRLKTPIVDFSLTHYSKRCTSPDTYNALFLELRARHDDAEFIFTDGSKIGEQTSCAFVYDRFTYSQRLTDNASIFTAEIKAIYLALKRIKLCPSQRHFVICSDSLSVLQCLHSGLLHNSMLVKVLHEYHSLPDNQVSFMWLPSHMDIPGNEAADKAAKEALNKCITPLFIPHSDYKPVIKEYVIRKWLETWPDKPGNHLYLTGATVNQPQPLEATNREDSVIRRVRMGHTRLTHAHLLCGADSPYCRTCHRRITVQHFLLDCTLYQGARARHFKATTVWDLFNKVPTANIIAFLKEINLFTKI